MWKYIILYSDGTKVEKLKEANVQFVLHKYKAECGKPHHRHFFFVLKLTIYLQLYNNA